MFLGKERVEIGVIFILCISVGFCECEAKGNIGFIIANLPYVLKC